MFFALSKVAYPFCEEALTLKNPYSNTKEGEKDPAATLAKHTPPGPVKMHLAGIGLHYLYLWHVDVTRPYIVLHERALLQLIALEKLQIRR